MLSSASSDTRTVPIAPALAAMMALQMLTIVALLAPSVMAPRIGIGAATLGLYATAACTTGMITTFIGGILVGRQGSFRMATLCTLVVLGASALSAFAGASALLIVAGVILGCAYGPETPASSAVLSRITPPATRPLVFSLRQTGNQIGAMLGSLALPWLAAADPFYGYAAIMAAAVVAMVAFEVLRPTYDPLVQGAVAIRLSDAVRVLLHSRDLQRLAIASMPYSALQIVLNSFLVIYAVDKLGLDLIAAGLLLAVAQGGGLIGRLLFGFVATRYVSAWATLTALGIGMSICAVLVALMDASWSWPVLHAVAFAFGVTASGWNGVFLAEVARLSPEGRVAEATGAVLVSGFCGLVLGPLFVASTVGTLGLATVYAILGLSTLGGTLALIGRPRSMDAVHYR
jgi:MFS family permease